MSAAVATAELPNAPDPAPADQATIPTPTRTGRVLGFLRKLIDYGKELAGCLKQSTSATAVLSVAIPFGTRDLALILRRIARGLRLAGALETRLVEQPLADFTRPPATGERPVRTTPADKKPPRPPLPDLPTDEDIAEAIRTRRVGALIVQICGDFGIVPHHPLWREMVDIVQELGADLGKVINVCADKVGFWLNHPSTMEEACPVPLALRPRAAFTTGPPRTSLAA
jgi:hypothetical protein